MWKSPNLLNLEIVKIKHNLKAPVLLFFVLVFYTADNKKMRDFFEVCFNDTCSLSEF